MKRTDDLKKQVESATVKEEKKEAVQQAGMLPTDDELDQVTGGRWVTTQKGAVYWEEDDEEIHIESEPFSYKPPFSIP